MVRPASSDKWKAPLVSCNDDGKRAERIERDFRTYIICRSATGRAGFFIFALRRGVYSAVGAVALFLDNIPNSVDSR